jgi:hypothetical protein
MMGNKRNERKSKKPSKVSYSRPKPIPKYKGANNHPDVFVPQTPRTRSRALLEDEGEEEVDQDSLTHEILADLAQQPQSPQKRSRLRQALPSESDIEDEALEDTVEEETFDEDESDVVPEKKRGRPRIMKSDEPEVVNMRSKAGTSKPCE